MQKINLNKISISLLKEGLLYIHLKSNTTITLTDCLQAVSAMGKITKGKKLPVLIDAGDFCSINNESRVYAASKAANIFTVADAIAVYDSGQQLIANFYLNNNKPTVPTKIFSNKKEAIDWLKAQINN